MAEDTGRIKTLISKKGPEQKLLGPGKAPRQIKLLIEGEKREGSLVLPIGQGRRTWLIDAKNDSANGQGLASLSRKAESILESAVKRSRRLDGKIDPENLPRLCRIGISYLKHRESQLPNLSDARESIHQNVSFAVLVEEAIAYMEGRGKTSKEGDAVELEKQSSRIIISFLDEVLRVEELEREILNSILGTDDGDGPGGANLASTPPSFPPILMARTEAGTFMEVEQLKAAQLYWEALDGDMPHIVFRAVKGPNGRPVPVREPEDQLTHKLLEESGQEHRRNVKFYYSNRARTGMDRRIWPAHLTEALEAERWWAGLLISSRKDKDGTFLECGGGDGRCLVQEHEEKESGKRFTLYEHFGHIISVDYSVQMGRAASRIIAKRIGARGVEKSRIITGELGHMGYLGSHFVDLAFCAFNTYGNLNVRDQMGMAKELNRVLRRYDPDASPPAMAFFTVYRERPETREMQREFYTNMGMRIVKIGGNVTITSTGENGGSSTLKSQRFTEDKLVYPMESNGLVVLDVFPISTIMWGAIAVSSDVSNGHGKHGSNVYRGTFEGTEIGRRIEEAKRRDETGNWDWDSPVE